MIVAVVAAILMVSGIFLSRPTTSELTRPSTAPGEADSTGSNASRETTSRESSSPDGDAAEDTAPAPVVWTAELPHGTHGSPRLYRDDARREMIIAYGDERKRIGGATAIDVVTGQSRWRITSEDEMFTLPVPLEPWPGGEVPWIVAGRNGQLYAVDARSGEQLWKFQPSGEDGRSQGVYNFFTGLPVPDANGDGIQDFVIPNGGDSRRNRFQSRPPGHLFVISGANGELIHSLPVPDGRETYLSPLLWNRGDESQVVFGTGGETFPGSLWSVPLESVRGGTLDGVSALVPSVESKGAIPPPSFSDMDRDGLLDLITAPFDGRLIVLSGRNLEVLWKFTPSGIQETQCSPTIGDFDGDGQLDVAYVTQDGIFPRWSASHVRVFNGAGGKLIWEHLIQGNLSAASPLALDIDADGRDELLIAHANPALFRPSSGSRSVSHLQIVHVEEDRIEEVGAIDGFNAGSGWIGDADEDGRLEWYVPLKMDDQSGRLVKVALPVTVPKFIAWGGYLGTHHDGVYHAPPTSPSQP